MSRVYIPRYYNFSSGSATIHTVIHNLNSTIPDVVVYNNATQEEIIPITKRVIDANTVEITLFTPLAIFGKVQE